MKTIIVFFALVALVMAAPQSGKDATIVRFENDNSGADGYKFNFETSDGITREEVGTLKDLGGEDGQAIVSTGSFSWKDEKTGQTYTVTFTADENGYKPSVKISK